MAKVVAVALRPFNIVANIYNPRSIKALGTTVEYFKRSKDVYKRQHRIHIRVP